VAVAAPEVEILGFQVPTVPADVARFRGNVTKLRNSVAQAHAYTSAAFLAARRCAAVGIADSVG